MAGVEIPDHMSEHFRGQWTVYQLRRAVRKALAGAKSITFARNEAVLAYDAGSGKFTAFVEFFPDDAVEFLPAEFPAVMLRLGRGSE